MAEHSRREVTDRQWRDAHLLWDFLLMRHRPKPCSAAIVLGSHDLGVATRAAELYLAGMVPVLVFSGSNSRTTAARFPRGEAAHYREHALALGVPDAAILVEPRATNTGENITYARAVLADAGLRPESVLLVSKPYAERRSYATARRLWPETEIVCASQEISLDDYVKGIGDTHLVVDMLVGDLQRIAEYPRLGFTVEQPIPRRVHAAYAALRDAGFVGRLISLGGGGGAPCDRGDSDIASE